MVSNEQQPQQNDGKLSNGFGAHQSINYQNNQNHHHRHNLQQQQQFELIVFGSIVQDLVSYVERFPKPGESVRGTTFKTFCGGKGANQAVMAAKLGTRVSMCAYVGDDIFAENNRNSIAQGGADISQILTLKGHSTGTACVSVTEDGENQIIVTLGANEQLGAKRATELEPMIANAKMIMCQQEVDQAGNLEAFRIAKAHGVKTFFNPAPGTANMDRAILALCDIICANENEAEFLSGLELKTPEDAEKCARRILEIGPRIVIITLGPKGAFVAQMLANGQIRVDQVDAPKVKAVDTVGAGDCFCGSLAHFLLANDGIGIGIPQQQNANGNGNTDETSSTADSVVAGVRKAVHIAAISVQKHGAQASYPGRKELEPMLATLNY